MTYFVVDVGDVFVDGFRVGVLEGPGSSFREPTGVRGTLILHRLISGSCSTAARDSAHSCIHLRRKARVQASESGVQAC